MLELLEARIQMDGSSPFTIGKPGAQVRLDGDFTSAYNSDEHLTRYTSPTDGTVTAAILGGDSNFHSLLRIAGTTSFEVYDGGFGTDDAGSFSIGTNQAPATLGVFVDSTSQTAQDIWKGSQTFALDTLFDDTGVALDLSKAISLRLDGSTFRTSNIQLVGASPASPGVQAHLRGEFGFEEADGLSTNVVGADFVRVGPQVGKVLEMEGAGDTGDEDGFGIRGMKAQPTKLRYVHVPGTTIWQFWAGLSLSTGDSKFTFTGQLGTSDENPGLTFEEVTDTDGSTHTTLKEFSLDLSKTNNDPGSTAQPGINMNGKGATNHIAPGSGEFGLTWVKGGEFKVYGRATFQSTTETAGGKVTPPLFQIDFGDAEHPGFATDNGIVTSFTIGVSTHFNIGPVKVNVQDAGLSYTRPVDETKPATLAFFGQASVQLVESWAGAAVALGTSPQNPGLIINLDTGQVELDQIAFEIVYLPVGGLVFQDLGFSYAKVGSDFEIKVQGTLILPAGWGVSVAFAFNDEGLESIAGGFTAAYDEPGIEIGDTGLSLYSATLAINNIENPEELSVAGSATFIYGDVVQVDGKDVTPFVAIGSFYVDRHKLEMDGDMYMIAYDQAKPATPPVGTLPTPQWKSAIGTKGEAVMDLDWSAGVYRLAVNNLTLMDIFVISGSITFDSSGDLVLAAEADVQVPNLVPIIGGTHIAGIDFLLAYDHSTGGGFVAAWANINLIFTQFEGGFEYAFDGRGQGAFSLIGAQQIGQLQQEAAEVISGAKKDADGVPLFSYMSRPITIVAGSQADGLNIEVVTPSYNVQGSIELNVPGQSNPLALGLGKGAVAWTTGDGLAMKAEANVVNGRVIVSVYPADLSRSRSIPAGDYKVTLVSPQQFTQSSIQFSSLLRYLPPLVMTPQPLFAPGATSDARPVTTLDVVFTGKIAQGLVKPLNKHVTVRTFIDANNDGKDYNGVLVNTYQADLDDSGNWSQKATFDFNAYRYGADVRVYATVDDSTNPVTRSAVVTQLQAAPLINGTIAVVARAPVAPSDPPLGTYLGTVPGLVAFVDLNHNGIYDAVSGSQAGGDLVMEPAVVSDDLGLFSLDPSKFFLDVAKTKPALVAGQTYDLVLRFPSDQYHVYANGQAQPAGTPARATFFYNGTTPTPLNYQVIAPTVIRGTVFDDPSGTLNTTDPEQRLLSAKGASGQTVYLDLNKNGQLDAGEPTSTTGASGQYGFYDGSGVTLAQGTTYIVALVLPPSAVTNQATQRSVSVNSPQDQLAFNDFFVRRLGSISGVVQGYPAGSAPSNSGLIDLSVPLGGRGIHATVGVVNYPEFATTTDLSDLSLVGSAAVLPLDNQSALFPAYTNQDNSAPGAFWTKNAVALNGGFDVSFQWQANSTDQPDGFAFVIQGQSNTALGYGDPQYRFLGYAGIIGSLAVVFDMQNNEIRLASGVNPDPVLALARLSTNDLGFALNNGMLSARILYASGQFSLFLNGSDSPSLTLGIDAILNDPEFDDPVRQIFQQGTPAFVGFTSAIREPGEGVGITGFQFRQIVASTASAADGSYTLGNLLPDVNYQVIQTLPIGWRQVSPASTNLDYQSVPLGYLEQTSGGIVMYAPTVFDVDHDGIPDLIFGVVYEPYGNGLKAPGYLIQFGDGKGGSSRSVAHYFNAEDTNRVSLSSIYDIRIFPGQFDAYRSKGDLHSFMFLINGSDNAGLKGITALVDIQPDGAYDYTLQGLYRPRDGQVFVDAAPINLELNNRQGAQDNAQLENELVLVAKDASGRQDVYFTPIFWQTYTNPYQTYTNPYYGQYLNPAIPDLHQADISVATGDINNDGYDDFVLCLPDSEPGGALVPRIYYGTGEPSNYRTVNLESFKITSGTPKVALGDLDGDGRLDLVILTSQDDDEGNGTIRYALQTAGGDFRMGQVAGAGGALVDDQVTVNGVIQVPFSFTESVRVALARMVVEDLNGDGLADIAVVSGAGLTITTFQNQGIAFFAQAIRQDLAVGLGGVTGFHDPVLADLNRDGLPDLVVGNGLDKSSYYDGPFGVGEGLILLSSNLTQAGVPVTLDSGQNRTGVNFQSAQFVGSGLGAPQTGTGVISGMVYRDTARNGQKGANDAGLAGVRVYLDLNRNGLRDSDEPTALTSASGTYRFANLAMGASYLVRLELTSGWVATTASQGAETSPGTVIAARFQDLGVAPAWFQPLPNLVQADLSRIVVTPQRTADAPSGTIVFQLGAGAPAGVTINASTGRVLWTPTADQAPGVYTISIIATRLGTIPTTEVQSFTVTLPVVNHAPTIAPIADQTLSEGGTLSLQATGTDRDPGQTLTYSLDPGAPAGMAIDARTGLLTWTATSRRFSGLVTVRVTDSDNPALSAATVFRVTVLPVAPTVVLNPVSTTTAGTTVRGRGGFTASSQTSWIATIDYGDGSAPVPLALAADRTFQFDHIYATAGTYAITVTVTDADGLSGTSTVAVVITPASVPIIPITPPQVFATIVGNGVDSAQRSNISQLVVAFDRVVSVAAGAFVLRNRAGRVIPTQVSFAVVEGRTVVTLTFGQTELDGASLANGRYTLTTRRNRIRDVEGRPVAVAPQIHFRRKFGDLNGDGRVSRAEVQVARKAVGSHRGEANYRAELDLSGSGVIRRGTLRRVLATFLGGR